MKKTPRQAAGTGERGFSLIELLIAMAVTLIVSGAVLMLLMKANQSFRTQPELTERQQNIRAAMDLIMRDIANAGAGLPQGVQVFTPGKNNVGPPSPVGTAADPNADELEMLTSDTGRDPVPACQNGGINVRIWPNNAQFQEQIPVMLLMEPTGGDPPRYSFRTITDIKTDSGGGDSCSGSHPRLGFNSGLDQSGRNPGGDVCDPDNFGMGNSAKPCAVATVLSMSLVRYYIGPAPDDPAMPVLWRQTGPLPGQQVARGIEDMQVRYRSAADITAGYTADCGGDPNCDLPLTQPVVWDSALGLGALTVEVQVVLASRGGLLVPAGQVATDVMVIRAADGTSAYRGSLRSHASPRAALMLVGGDGRWQ